MNQLEFTSASTGLWALVWTPSAQSHSDRTILYLHGAGGFGSGIAGLYEYPDLPSLLRDGLELDCRVVIPSCHYGEEWDPSVLALFLDDLDRAYGKPENGYDLLGYSRGGCGAYGLAAADPSRIRTIAAISTKDMLDLAPRIATLPVFICHGGGDQRTPVGSARRMHQTLQEFGCNSTLSVIEGDHFIIAAVLADGLVFRWQRDAI
jgi:pimeloyl-ACP methyl ester carboxylesterase